MIGTVLGFLLVAVPTVIAITLHEAAHGYAALWMGDDTARQAGRLSLNPLRHVDRVGTILLPALLLISQLLTIGRVAFMFGWAKPVPVSAWRFRNPRRGMMVVAAAGPAMNFLLAWFAAVALHAVPDDASPAGGWALTFLFYFMLSNIVLGLFNLLPIPPFDGGRIMVGLLPDQAARIWARAERFGLILVMGALFLLPALLQQVGVSFNPVRALLGAATEPAFRILLTLAGQPSAGMRLLDDGPGS